MTEPTETEAELPTAHWTYLGVAAGVTLKRVAVWRDEGTKERFAFKSIPETRGTVGMIYEIPIRDDGHALVTAKRWTGLAALDKTDLQLMADAERRRLSEDTAAQSAKKNAEASDLFAHCERVAAKLNWQAREELVKQINRVVLSA